MMQEYLVPLDLVGRARELVQRLRRAPIDYYHLGEVVVEAQQRGFTLRKFATDIGHGVSPATLSRAKRYFLAVNEKFGSLDNFQPQELAAYKDVLSAIGVVSQETKKPQLTLSQQILRDLDESLHLLAAISLHQNDLSPVWSEITNRLKEISRVASEVAATNAEQVGQLDTTISVEDNSMVQIGGVR